MEEEQVKLAVVKQIIGRTGSRGGVTQVKVQFIDDPGRTLIRKDQFAKTIFFLFLKQSVKQDVLDKLINKLIDCCSSYY